ncbi:MAG TPA: hypothetical protein VK436_09835 [Methanocella sp.]|nr:hypothetical protein [Methanocella sp.]
MLQIRYSSRIGLLAMFSTVAWMVLAGTTYSVSPFLAVLSALLAIISALVFFSYVYQFVYSRPQYEAKDFETEGETK